MIVLLKNIDRQHLAKIRLKTGIPLIRAQNVINGDSVLMRTRFVYCNDDPQLMNNSKAIYIEQGDYIMTIQLREPLEEHAIVSNGNQ